MAEHPAVPIALRTLHDGSLVRIRDYSCHAPQGAPGAEEASEADSIVLMPTGAFCRHVGRGRPRRT
jgi:hypothetical protein